MAKYPEKMRKGKRRRREDLSDHVSGSGQTKKKMRPQHAKEIAARTGMNAYHCAVCGSWHVGRSREQLSSDGWKKGKRY